MQFSLWRELSTFIPHSSINVLFAQMFIVFAGAAQELEQMFAAGKSNRDNNSTVNKILDENHFGLKPCEKLIQKFQLHFSHSVTSL